MEIYKVIDWLDNISYVFCEGNSEYKVARYYKTYCVLDYFMSSDFVLYFIADQHRTYNAETTSGIKLVERVQYSSLPKLVKQTYKL